MAETKVKMPGGIPYIIGNELAERFSYYGMKTILIIFMTKYLMTHAGVADHMNDNEAKEWYHLFSMANYFFPILGALVADIFWGKYKTIMLLSIVYVLGHAALAIDDTRIGLSIGLTLIAIGSGGIKPCVSAHVGDQFEEKNKKLIDKIFSYFYFAINFGSFFSTLLIPVVLDKWGPHLAFGIPGVLMLIATIVFYMGNKKYIAIPPRGLQEYKKEIFSPAGKKAIKSLSFLYLFIAMFWALYDQTGSSWVLQADKMDTSVNLGFVKFTLLPSQIQAINPILVMLMIPIFTYFIYPWINKIYKLTAVRKIIIGLFLAAGSFVLIAMAEALLQSGVHVGIIWQFWAYVIITAAEVMVSITGLEFSYTQSPNGMKSFVMGMWLMAVSLGNAFTALINGLIGEPGNGSILDGAAYFWFFAGLMLLTALVFSFVASKYKEESFVQKREDYGAGDLNPTLVEN